MSEVRTEIHAAAGHVADLMATMGHPHRLMLVLALADGPKDTRDLMVALGISQIAVVEHLRVLKGRRIVLERRDEGRVSYELTWPDLAAWLAGGFDVVNGHPAPTARLVELPRLQRGG